MAHGERSLRDILNEAGDFVKSHQTPAALRIPLDSSNPSDRAAPPSSHIPTPSREMSDFLPSEHLKDLVQPSGIPPSPSPIQQTPLPGLLPPQQPPSGFLDHVHTKDLRSPKQAKAILAAHTASKDESPSRSKLETRRSAPSKKLYEQRKEEAKTSFRNRRKNPYAKPPIHTPEAYREACLYAHHHHLSPQAPNGVERRYCQNGKCQEKSQKIQEERKKASQRPQPPTLCPWISARTTSDEHRVPKPYEDMDLRSKIEHIKALMGISKVEEVAAKPEADNVGGNEQDAEESEMEEGEFEEDLDTDVEIYDVGATQDDSGSSETLVGDEEYFTAVEEMDMDSDGMDSDGLDSNGMDSESEWPDGYDEYDSDEEVWEGDSDGSMIIATTNYDEEAQLGYERRDGAYRHWLELTAYK